MPYVIDRSDEAVSTVAGWAIWIDEQRIIANKSRGVTTAQLSHLRNSMSRWPYWTDARLVGIISHWRSHYHEPMDDVSGPRLDADAVSEAVRSLSSALSWHTHDEVLAGADEAVEQAPEWFSEDMRVILEDYRVTVADIIQARKTAEAIGAPWVDVCICGKKRREKGNEGLVPCVENQPQWADPPPSSGGERLAARADEPECYTNDDGQEVYW